MTKKKPESEKLKAGRPTDYRPEFCAQAREMFKKGYSKVEIASAFGVNRRTMDDWAEKYPEFYRTIHEDLDLSEGWWMGQGRENIANKNFNSRLYELNMMNRFGWKRKNEEKQITQAQSVDELKELE